MTRKGIPFLKTVSTSEAERIWHAALNLGPFGPEEVPLAQAQRRILDDDFTVLIPEDDFDQSRGA